MTKDTQNIEFVDRLLAVAQSFLDEHRYESARDVYLDIMEKYNNRYEAFLGYIRAVTYNYTKVDVTRAFINELRDIEDKAIKLCDNEDKKEEIKVEVDEYLDHAYDILQTKLENINGDAAKLHARQIASEQIAKNEYKSVRKKLVVHEILAIALVVVFSLGAIISLVLAVFQSISANSALDDINVVVLGQMTVIYALIFIIFALLTSISIRVLVISIRKIKKSDQEFNDGISKIAEEYTVKYKESQLEYERLNREIEDE